MRIETKVSRASPRPIGQRVPTGGASRPGSPPRVTAFGAGWRGLLLALAAGAAASALADNLVPFEFQQPGTTHNLQAVRGVPISSVSNSPAGSDGRMTTVNESGGYNTPTVGQFQSFVGFGATAARTNWLTVSGSPLLEGANPFSAAVATAMQLPRAYSNGVVSMVLRRAQVGAPYLARRVDFAFGSIVEVPAANENGDALSVVKETYWQAEPYSTNSHADTGYYYSPHARKVFAIQAGPLTVTWRKLSPYTAATLPTNYVNQSGPQNFETNGGSIYLLHTKNYIVSGSAVKTPLNMYWTEREYRVTGFPVSVPRGRVGGISIAYNNEFPRTVEEEYHGPGWTSPTEGGTNQALPELRTLWYDQGQGFIYAHNKEGRAFVEFLGDASPDGRTREHLGYEIVDVIRQPVAADLTVELGERMLPPAPESGDDLYAEPVITMDALYVYRHTQPVSGRLNLYAAMETTSQNDSLVHWLEAGTAGIKWPKAFARYTQIWPREMASYSHYVRPAVATEAEARSTAIQLSTENVPFISYQDPLDRPRAKLTEDFKFYTHLDTTVPAHRALLRFTSGEHIAFERVFSWLDSSLRSTNYVGSVATNLTEVDNYINYPAHYADYTNRLAAAMAVYRPQYVAYTNYLQASSNYVSQFDAYATYRDYTNKLASYRAYTNWQANYTAYTNYLVQSAAYNTQLAAYNTYTAWDNSNYSYTNYIANTNFSSDFASFPARASTFGSAYIAGGALSLVGPYNSQVGSFVLPTFTSPFNVTNFTATFYVSMNIYSSPPGDGFSFNFGTVNTNGTPGYLEGPEGIASGLSVCFDLYDNYLGDLAPGITIKRNNILVHGVNMSGSNPNADTVSLAAIPIDPNTGQGMTIYGPYSVYVKIELTSDGRMSVYYKNQWVLSNVATGYTPRNGRFALYASTGGSYCNVGVDLLQIGANVGLAPASPGSAPPYVTNPGSAPTVVSNPGSAPVYAPHPDTYFAEQAAAYNAYTNYLYAIRRGVNTNWNLNLQDWGQFLDGTLGSWVIQVLSTNLLSGAVLTNEFTYSSPMSMTYGVASIASLTVSGITNPVGAVRLKLNNLSHDRAYDIHAWLTGPGGRSVTLLESPASSPQSVANLMLVIDDAGQVSPYWSSLFTSGTYKPRAGTMDSLLDAVPAYAPPTNHPGTYVANPGTAPTVVLEPTMPDVGPVPSPNLWTSDFTTPRLDVRTVYVGDRIAAPAGELGESSYLAGHINTDLGTLYHPGAYVNPLASGFTAANRGAIIPVNAVPGANLLEVWWFRTNRPAAGPNAGNQQLGFATIYWPAVLGRYTIAWPENPREIVLASKLGSGTLSTMEALGSIYRQNNPALPGYNPNEEHALMSGGQAFATRDDLNLTSPANYSSDPFVLVQHTASDGRPAVAAFKVLREKPSEGYVFDYIVPAGQILQPPPPLTFLAKPVLGSGDDAVNYNTEPPQTGGDLPGGWTSAFEDHPLYRHYQRFTWRDRHDDFWVYRGPHAGIPSLQAGTYLADTKTFTALPEATAVTNDAFSYTVHASRQDEYLALTVPAGLPEWLAISGLSLRGTPRTNHVGTNVLELIVEDLYDHTRVTNSLRLAVVETGAPVAQAPLTLASTNSQSGTIVQFSNRPPFLAASPTPTNSFTMRYYYKTEASFDWPGEATPPAVGSIVPYLRPINPTTGAFIGAAAVRDTESLAVVYRPIWPVRDPQNSARAVPSLPFGETLTTPKWNLPGVRDMLTAQVLYQQSAAANITEATPSVVLHDATRAKYADLEAQALSAVPGGVRTDYYQGKYYFPNLPPHLTARLCYDPNRGAEGTLVLNGAYVRETMGESYVMLNVLRGSDLAIAKGLCPAGDPDKSAWDALVEALATDVETFYEDPDQPGSYIPDPDSTVSVGVGALAQITSDNSAVDSYALSAVGPGSGYVTLLEGDGTAFTEPGDPVAMHIFKVDASQLYLGEVKVIAAANPLSEQVTFQHTADLAGRFDEYEYEWRIAAPVDGMPPVADAEMSAYLSLASGADMPRRTIGGAGIQALSDNYVVMRYRAISLDHPLYHQWSDWTPPKLAEGWIKRVLAGINPFNQRVADLFNNRVNTDASILSQAGRRWEGDVALNLDTMNDYGLIEIYETILRRGRMLSIESGYNYGPANDALLLAAGYLSDLYMMEGGEAWADAANPTIGIGTSHSTYGDIATSLFAFKGQTASLLEEELSLLRGRDDVLMPGVQTAPVYNRLVWNYTRGIDAGEVIYALNYNIQENPDHSPDGVINAADAAIMFPQGHGDAYGHYLTALKGYYSLLLNSRFDWVPRIEAVNVLGQPVSVDYLDERKFAAAASATARAGRQIFDLTWRKDFQPVHTVGWSHFGATRVNAQRSYVSLGGTNNVTRYWSLDHWATRSVQGAYLSWVVGNAIVPAQDPNPLHEGIQKIERSRVPELAELAVTAEGLQTALDNAEGGLSPLGIPEGGIAFDLNPAVVVGTDNGTHFEQVYQRTKTALNNAVASFDDAKDVTRLMRSEQDSLADFQARVAEQEHAYRNSLIELYGTPYPEDIGAGKTYVQGYAGPDLVHYMYAELPEVDWGDGDGNEPVSFKVDVQTLPEDWLSRHYTDFDFVTLQGDGSYTVNEHFVEFELGPHGFYDKPAAWSGARYSPGKIQQAISEMIAAHARVAKALDDAKGGKEDLDKAIRLFKADVATHDTLRDYEQDLLIAEQTLASVEHAFELIDAISTFTSEEVEGALGKTVDALPLSFIAGVAAGGDLTSPARAAITAAGLTITTSIEWANVLAYIGVSAFGFANDTAARWTAFNQMAPLEWEQELRGAVAELGSAMNDLGDTLGVINLQLRSYEDAQRKYRALVAEGDRVQEEREIFRQRSSAVIQGFRTRDAAFRLFRNEKLERYKTLFDLAARYCLLAANAYDYETGLLGTSAGRSFKNRIINARALGVVRNGEPQYAGSNTGDPGLSSALAEMKADWDVLRGRLGFNNPDAYGTTVSLRTEKLRILPTADGDATWKDVLQAARVKNLLEDSDVRRYCMQIDDGSGLPVPGIVLTFSTTIADGYNLFGRELAAGDHAFTPSSFATKIFGVGAAFMGYRGMDDPSANSGGGGITPPDPDTSFLDPLALSATPYVYLIPVGVDSMRSPPLGDANMIRTWSVEDVAIPMPFNIGASDFSTRQLWQSSDSLTEPLFSIRKHQAFRPVSTTAVFSPSLYGDTGTLRRSQFTNNRLVGRSVWNSQWKLVIPGKTLLNDPNEGLDRFLQTVTDVKLHFATYSYSGN